MLKERVDGRITLSESDRVAQAMLNASLGQPAHFQVYLNHRIVTIDNSCHLRLQLLCRSCLHCDVISAAVCLHV